jgi:hypothetical protein
MAQRPMTELPTLKYYIETHNPANEACCCDRCFAQMIVELLDSLGHSLESLAQELDVSIADLRRDLYPTTTSEGVAIFLN